MAYLVNSLKYFETSPKPTQVAALHGTWTEYDVDKNG